MGRIVITGASSDIGLAIARRLAALGTPMLLHCRSHADRFAGIDAEIVRADFSDRRELERFIAQLGEVDILVTTLLCRAVVPGMCLRRRGVIVNLSSVTASRVFRGQTVYGGTKAYIEAFTKGLAAEYAKKGVRCNCVAPGSIDSGSLQKLLIATGSDTLKDINASARFGTPEDVAAAVAFLCSDESRYINGAVLHVDGGYWLGL